MGRERNNDISNRACHVITSPLPRTRKYQTKVASEEFKPGLYPVADVTTSMTGTNVTEVLYDGKIYSVHSWRDLFDEICNIANNYDPELLKNIAKNNTIHKSTKTKNYPNYDPIITDNRDLVNDAVVIENTNLFIESNLSSNRVRVYSKQLLDTYGLTDYFQINVTA